MADVPLLPVNPSPNPLPHANISYVLDRPYWLCICAPDNANQLLRGSFKRQRIFNTGWLFAIASELETQVEELRSNVINRRCRVNMSNVESMALVLSKASRTVADLKNRFPALQVCLMLDNEELFKPAAIWKKKIQ